MYLEIRIVNTSYHLDIPFFVARAWMRDAGQGCCACEDLGGDMWSQGTMAMANSRETVGNLWKIMEHHHLCVMIIWKFIFLMDNGK